MRRAFLTVNGRTLHYRTGGQGSPVVMLHPSPLSSAAVLPLAQQLEGHFAVYAFDTPGYGLSDPLPQRPTTLEDYLPTFAAALDALGLPQVCLYGAATGAQFAIEFANRYPDRVAMMVIDSAGHIPADECESIVRDYFPDLTPHHDGRHVMTLWQMVRDLFVFFPWCDRRAERRIDRDLPPAAVMQGMLLDYLRAGADYHLAYRPAFYNERAERAQQVRVPSALVRWDTSIVLRITDALIDAGLPENYTVLRLGPTPAERFGGIRQHLLQHYRAPVVQASPASPQIRGQWHSRFIDVAGGQVHARVLDGGAGMPRLWLHDAGESAALVAAGIAVDEGRGPILAFDLPGHGETEIALPAGDGCIDALADTVLAAIDAMDLDAAQIGGAGAGAVIAAAVAQRRPQVLRLDVSAMPTAAQLASESLPNLAPRLDGTHLAAAWQLVRDTGLWRREARGLRSGALPGEPRLDARHLQQRFVELMKAGDNYRSLLRAAAARLHA